jgi:hypothetical protein
VCQPTLICLQAADKNKITRHPNAISTFRTSHEEKIVTMRRNISALCCSFSTQTASIANLVGAKSAESVAK